jgi:2'-5' RNA ligase
MIRLFTAIDIPEPIRILVQGMGRSIQQSKPVPVDQLHLTLKFIGEVESSKLLDIQESLEQIYHPKFSLRLQGVGTFPPRGTPRILWAGVVPVENISRLRHTVEKKLTTIGIPKERQKYSPHITLARLRNSPVKQLHQYLAGNAFLKTPEFLVESFKLYSSHLSPKGAVHTLESSYPLE